MACRAFPDKSFHVPTAVLLAIALPLVFFIDLVTEASNHNAVVEFAALVVPMTSKVPLNSGSKACMAS